jgi:hypothetical protein
VLDVACGTGSLTLALARLTRHVTGIVETAFASRLTPQLPLDAILATSFPDPGGLEEVRAVYLADAQSGADTLGLRAQLVGGQIMIQYPMTLAVWQRG